MHTLSTTTTTKMFDRSKNLEFCRLILLQSPATHRTIIDREYWRSVVDFVEVFTDWDACLNHLKTVHNESVFLIVDTEWYEELGARILQLRLIDRIYIYNARDDEQEGVTAPTSITPPKLNSYKVSGAEFSYCKGSPSLDIRYISKFGCIGQ